MSTAALDASLYIHGSAQDRSQFASDLVHRLGQDGFVKLRNHGIAREQVLEFLSWQQRFFNLPIAHKMSCIHKGGSGPVRGFNSSDQEKSSKLYPGNEGIPDAKDALESLNVGPLTGTRYPNQWIAEEVLPTFRQHIEACYTLFQHTSTTIFSALELGLNLPPNSLLSRALPNVGELRLNHYPAISKHELLKKNTRRIWPHTDFGSISLLFQDSAGGLEFEDRRNPGAYVPVTSDEPDDLIVAVADILQRWTNDELKAGLHRVSVPRQFHSADDDAVGEDEDDDDCVLPDRYSLVFFCRPSEETSAGVIQGFVSEGRTARYEEISSLEHLERRNRLVY